MGAILITGAAGYIGSHVAKHFLELGREVIAVDDFSRGYREAIEAIKPLGSLELYEGDICDQGFMNSVMKIRPIDVVIHLAALCNPNESFDIPNEYDRINVTGTQVVLNAMREADLHKLIFASTCSVYEDKDGAVRVEDKTTPHNPYAQSKLVAEKAIEEFAKEYELHYLIFRFFNVCGADTNGLIGDSKKPSQLLMQNAVRGALNIEAFAYTYSEVTTPDGSPIRDYIDVLDLARAHELGEAYLEQGKASCILNLGSGQGMSVKEIVSAVEATLGVSLEKKQTEARKGEPIAVFADPSEAKALIGWKAQKSLKDSILSLAEWYRKHPDGYSR